MIKLSADDTLARALIQAGKDNLLNFFKENYKLILIVLFLISLALILIYNRLLIFILQRKIRDTKIESDVLTDLIGKAQKDYYARGSITKETFDLKTAKFKEGLTIAKRRLPVLEGLLTSRLSKKKIL